MPSTTARHRAFIGPRLIGSSAALGSIPFSLAMRGVPSTLEIVVFAWLLAPILIAYYLSRTGHYDSAHVLSSLALTGLVTMVAAKTGGITLLLRFAILASSSCRSKPHGCSASRRVVATASTLALLAAGLLILCNMYHLLPTLGDRRSRARRARGARHHLGGRRWWSSTGLALGAESLALRELRLLYAEEDRYRLLARNMTDVITRHGRNGIVLFASPAAERLFGATVAELLGHGLFDRVHVADRPAYLTALAAGRDDGQSVEFRVRRDCTACGGESRQRVHLDRDALPSARRLARRRRRDARS